MEGRVLLKKNTSGQLSNYNLNHSHFGAKLILNMKKLITCLLVLSMIFSLAACSGTEDEWEEDESKPMSKSKQSIESNSTDSGDWVIYWYLCGSDLESESGFATDDLEELMEVTLPEDVKVIIQTGGANTWHNDFVDPSKLQRFVYDSDGLELVDELPLANMGEKQTLYDFLSFANENYPADKIAVLFWNHGGGSVSGAEFDELFDNDSLTLDEMYEAFAGVWDVSEEYPPIEIIGFDTCLMATIDVAATFSGIAKYLVASEELEPANGWDYSEWIGALAANPAIDGAALGKVICDSYYAGCEDEGTEQDITLSVTDLTKVGPLIDAYDIFGAECLAAVMEDAAFLSEFARAAYKSENYGGNTREQGYTNMVDLGDLARQNAGIMKSAEHVLAALDECVIYQVRGPYRSRASGLSCYYSYNGDVDDITAYQAIGIDTAFKHYFTYALTGQLDETGQEYVANMDFDFTDLPEIRNLLTAGWDGAPLDLDDEGTAFLELGPEAQDILVGIGVQLYYIEEESDMMMLLGTDNDIVADWDNGIFYDNFRGVWGAIDDCLVYMELSEEGEDYNLYSVPVLLNGEEYNLKIVYDFNDDTWIILGARKGIDDNGMADKELRLLKPGDEVTTIWKIASYSGEDEFEDYEVDTITVTANTAFSERPLFDGTYCMEFEMWDAMGNYAYSDPVQFDCVDGEIMTTVFED
ncbi:MAG: clostripain [Clostridiaceae bacterium]|mgnify:CR=1 FL=1|jgi:hypothetical protein|nr:clostripain [Clostridiaceae bacterium]